LRPIRKHVGLSSQALAAILNCTPKWVEHIEAGKRDCTQKLQRRIASVLNCTVLDLLGQPDQQRLHEIAAAYHLREAQQAGQGAA